ncbi:hypothetical protein ACFX2I_023916 [Malus domestica]
MACTFKVLEQRKVSPPKDSVPTTSLPLIFLDIPWLGLACYNLSNASTSMNPPTYLTISYKFSFHHLNTLSPSLSSTSSRSLETSLVPLLPPCLTPTTPPTSLLSNSPLLSPLPTSPIL